MTDRAAFLRNVPVLRGLGQAALEQVASRLRVVEVPAGEWIMRRGEIGEHMFIVSSGRVEVVDEGPPEVLMRVLRRGDIVGELALLGVGTRSASARARRDSEMLELARSDFESLIQAPAFALGLVRAMGSQLAESRTPMPTGNLPRTIAVVGLDHGLGEDVVARRLATSLGDHGSVTLLREGVMATIDQAERDVDRVVLGAGHDPDDAWTSLSVREADLLLAVSGTGGPGAKWSRRADGLRGCELLVLGTPAAGDLVAAAQPRGVQVIADISRLPLAIEALGRRLAGRSVGVVLSGGGARAFAHVGVLEELRAAGIRFDRIAGVSLGSLVAAAAAAGYSPEQIHDELEQYMVKSNPTIDFVPPVYSLIRGAKTRRMVHERLDGLRIEELELRFFCVSCDLLAREPVVHRTGPVADAVCASLAVPGIFPPVRTADGRLLVDGAVLNNLPVDMMASAGEGPIIAVDVAGSGGRAERMKAARFGRIAKPMRRALTGSESEIPRIAETFLRTLTAGSIDTVAAARAHATVVITPQVEGISFMGWKELDRVRAIGRSAARDALAEPGVADRLGI
jgi:NTE family protein